MLLLYVVADDDHLDKKLLCCSCVVETNGNTNVLEGFGVGAPPNVIVGDDDG